MEKTTTKQGQGEDIELLQATRNITAKEQRVSKKFSLLSLSDPSSIYSEMLAEVEAEISGDDSEEEENEIGSDSEEWVTCDEKSEWTVHREEISVTDAVLKQIEKKERSVHREKVSDKDSDSLKGVEDGKNEETQTKSDKEDKPSESKKLKLDDDKDKVDEESQTFSNRVIELAPEKDGTKLQVNLGPSKPEVSQEKVGKYNTIVMERYEMEEQIRKRRRITRNLLKQNIKVRFYEDIEEKYRQKFGL